MNKEKVNEVKNEEDIKKLQSEEQESEKEIKTDNSDSGCCGGCS